MRCAVLGGGVMGVLHARAYARIRDVELVGIVEPANERAAQLTQLGLPVVANAAHLGEVDAVSVCAPDDVRLKVLGPFLETGTPLLVEKPFATSVAECEAIMALAAPNQIMVGQLMRFDPRVATLRAALAGDGIGDLWTGKIWRCSNTSTAARIASRTSVAWFLGIHDVDLVRHVTGREVASVRATGHSVISSNHDIVRGQMILDDGGLIGFDWSWVWPDSLPAGMTAGIELVGSSGAATSDLGHDSVHLFDQRSGRHRVPDVFHWPTGHGGIQIGDISEEIEAFVDAVRIGGPMPVTPADATASVEVIEAVHRSCSADGALVTVSG